MNVVKIKHGIICFILGVGITSIVFWIAELAGLKTPDGSILGIPAIVFGTLVGGMSVPLILQLLTPKKLDQSTTPPAKAGGLKREISKDD